MSDVSLARFFDGKFKYVLGTAALIFIYMVYRYYNP